MRSLDSYLSRTIVTGPSLTSDTSIIAPKRPVSTGGTPVARSRSQKWSKRRVASSGGAAPTKLGRFPLRVSARRVN